MVTEVTLLSETVKVFGKFKDPNAKAPNKAACESYTVVVEDHPGTTPSSEQPSHDVHPTKPKMKKKKKQNENENGNSP